VSFIVKDKLTQVVGSINALVKKKVLVGIPESTAERSDDEDEGPMNNATLGYIHENGSPAANIPARPFLIPGVEDVEDKIASRLKKASKAAVDGKSGEVDRQFEAAGMIAEQSVKNKINDGDFAPLKPSTIANRRRSRGTESMRDSEKEYMELIASGAQAAGMSLSEIESEAGIQPLVNTGQLRNSITHVIRG